MQGKNRMKYFYTVGKTTALLISCLLFSAAIYAEDGKKGQKKDDQEKPDKKAAVLIMRDEEMKKELFQGKELVGCPSALSITVNVVLNSAASPSGVAAATPAFFPSPCTADSCDPKVGGCVHAPAAGP